MSEKYFKGTLKANGRSEVLFDGNPVPLYLGEVNHSPDGFAWGYGGSGPSQLAYAMLRTVLQDQIADPKECIFWARSLYHDFKWDIVAKLPKNSSWMISYAEVMTWIWKNQGSTSDAWERSKEF